MSSIIGNINEKSLPRYEVLSLPVLTEAPMGQLRSIMTQLQSGLGLALVMNAEQWPEGIGCFLNGPKRTLYFFSSSMYAFTSVGNSVADL